MMAFLNAVKDDFELLCLIVPFSSLCGIFGEFG